MDPTIIAAVAGVLGVILGAVIGGVFALKATNNLDAPDIFRVSIDVTVEFARAMTR